jgi:competence protein ComEA
MRETESLRGKTRRWAFSLKLVIMGALLLSACVQQPRHSLSVVQPSLTPAANGGLASRRLNINTVSAADLEMLPGIGKITAERIVAYREQYGPFRRVEHLLMVPGFSNHKFRELREKITAE